MAEFYSESPVAYWTIMYILVCLLLLVGSWERGDLNKLGIIRVILWPLLFVSVILLLIVFGALTLWDKISPEKNEEEQNE